MGYKARAVILVFIMVGIISAYGLSSRLPIPKKTSGKNEKSPFSGVLRLWICEKTPVGGKNLSAWLNSESAKFEKKNDGIYIQITPVSEETMANFACKTEYPPDIIVVTPRVLADDTYLLPLRNLAARTSHLPSSSSALCPIALGASVWAVNTEKVTDGTLSGKTLYISKSVSALSASAALFEEASKNQTAPSVRFGIDLSLPVPEEENIGSEETVIREIIPGSGSMRTGNALSSFIKGKCDAVLICMSELSTLLNASAAPDFELKFSGVRYTEDAAFFAVTDTDKTSDPVKQAVCVKFLDHLLSGDAQSRLAAVNAFPVSDCASLYSGRKGFYETEMYLSEGKILLPEPFGIKNTASFEEALDGFLSGKGGAADFLEKHIHS